jgi:hypothetical protein
MGDTFHGKRSLAPLASALTGIRGERMEQVHLTLAARFPDYSVATPLKELQERHTLVRTWGVRGLLQVVSTPELPLYLGAAGASPRWKRFLESRSPLGPQARLRLLKRLCPKEISRDKLREAFPDASTRQFVLRESAQAGHIVWSGGDGAAARFGWTKDVLGKVVEPQRNYQELVARYLTTYGPLTAADLSFWLGVTVAAARQIMAKHRVAEVQVEGESTPYFIHPAGLDALVATRKRDQRGFVVIAPGDPLVTAYKTRWRENEDSGDMGLAFEDGRLVARWSLGRADAKIEPIDPELTKKVHKAVRSLLERAGVNAAMLPV